MKGHRLEVADVFRQYGKKFQSRWGHTLSPQQRKAMRDIGICRTAALGGHVEECDHCSNRLTVFNSCRNRNCPKCQSRSRDKWLAKQAEQMLPVPYCHVVFTVPDDLAPLALRNQRLFYTLLFRAAAQTLLMIAADARHLGARIGFLAVLHTWSQNLLHRPHLHCLVPAGGIIADGSKWISCRSNFFLPVRVLSRLFRGKLLAFLAKAYAEGKLQFNGTLEELADPMQFGCLLDQLRKKEWVVYAKPPFGGPQHVLKYLARYTHRVAISNGRLVSLTNDRVSFRWRDSKNGNRIGIMTLDAVEFIRRFLLHVLPSGFVKIRHFGFLANRNHSRELALCRQHLHAQDHTQCSSIDFSEEQQRAMEHRCPVCMKGTLHIVAWLSEQDLLTYGNTPVAFYSIDSS
jgi:hypothetical protein